MAPAVLAHGGAAPPARRRSVSLPLRISLISLVFAAVVATVLTALGGYFLHAQQTDNAAVHARMAADELAGRAARLLALGLKLDDLMGFDEQCEAVVSHDALLKAAAVYGPDRQRRIAGTALRIRWPDAWQGELGSGPREVATPEGRLVMRPIVADGPEVQGYAVAMVHDEAVLKATLSRVAWLVASALLLFGAGLLVQQAVFWHTVGRPLAGLVSTADEIQPDSPPELTLRRAGEAEADDDIGRLYGAFNRLLQRVADARQQLLAQNEQLEATVRERTLQLELANAELEHDIRRREQLEEELRRLANTDALTGLANRAFVMPYAERRLLQAARQGGPFGVMLFDLDGFKAINDTHGHAAGDAVLQAMAGRLAGICRSSDVLARLGGDEFLLVFEDFTSDDQVQSIARRMLAQFSQPVAHAGLQLQVGVSLGAALFPAHGQTLEALLAAADEAMYTVKQRGGGLALAVAPAGAAAASLSAAPSAASGLHGHRGPSPAAAARP